MTPRFDWGGARRVHGRQESFVSIPMCEIAAPESPDDVEGCLPSTRCQATVFAALMVESADASAIGEMVSATTRSVHDVVVFEILP